MSSKPADARVLDRLYGVITARRTADPEASYTARLLARGPAGTARKFGEEAIETVVAACTEDRDRLAAESADVLYHMLVLWAAGGVKPEEVWSELSRREGLSGLAEKAARGKE
jgi:phosphoribosyl-ATP pyrophosphohydrolase